LADLQRNQFWDIAIRRRNLLGILDKEDNEERRYQALHHMFIASALAVKIGHEINPEFNIGCMLAYMTMYPLTCKPEDALANQELVKKLNWFCGDVQVKGKYPYYMNHYFEKQNIHLEFAADDERFYKKARSIFTHSPII
jgi:6-phospho-beta-glucosidase